MKKFLMLNGKKIELTEEQITKIKQSFGVGNVKLSDLKPAETFKIGEYKFFVLEQLEDATVVFLKDLLKDGVKFGDGNNYNGCNVDKMCVKFGDEIESLVGEGNLIEHTVDLTSDDGLKCYGSIVRKMSVLTAEQYRKYVYCIDEHRLDKWWWLATAYSTPKHDENTWIKGVSPRGYFIYDYCSISSGVRPFCILKSNIFVSK